MARWGKCDFKQLEALQKKMKKMARADSRRFCEEAARELAARLLAKVIKRTPVGKYAKQDVVDEVGNKVIYKSGKRKGEAKQQVVKKGGTLRRGWTSKTEAEAENGTGSGDAASYAAGLPVTQHGGVYEIEIVNPVSYAPYVEFGHRQQPGRYVPALGKSLKSGWVNGRYMLTISEKELRAMMPALLEKKLRAFMEECFHAE